LGTFGTFGQSFLFYSVDLLDMLWMDFSCWEMFYLFIPCTACVDFIGCVLRWLIII